MVTLVTIHVTMIAPNHMFKVDLSKFLKHASRYIFNSMGCPKKQCKLQVNEILSF